MVVRGEAAGSSAQGAGRCQVAGAGDWRFWQQGQAATVSISHAAGKRDCLLGRTAAVVAAGQPVSAAYYVQYGWHTNILSIILVEGQCWLDVEVGRQW